MISLSQQIAEDDPRIDIEYKRVVKPEGNIKAQEILNKVFKVSDAYWRGIGKIKNSGLAFKDRYEGYDAARKFQLKITESIEPKGCICGNVLLGLNLPPDCVLFGKRCTPLSPVGPCMVSSEGSCAAYYKYDIKRRGREREREIRGKGEREKGK